MRRLAALLPFALPGLVLLACQSDYSVDSQGSDGGGVTCDGSTCSLPAVDAASSDASSSDAAVDGGDAGDDARSGALPVGASCTKPADCASGLCADSAVLGQDAFAKVGAVCTTPCCSSEKCGAGLVCLGAGTGGHYCVPAAPLGRPVGTSSGGHTCTKADDCRAGVCVGGVCADSCCGAANCSMTTTCKPVDVEGNGHETYACSAAGGPGAGQSCNGAVDACGTGVCVSGTCAPPCCGLASVMGSGNNLCKAAALSNGDTFSFAESGPVGMGAVGEACTLPSQCKSGYCDKADGSATGTCSDICCTDGDCGKNFVCRPRTGVTHFLRCVPP